MYGATRYETGSNLPTEKCSAWDFQERVDLSPRGRLRFAVDTDTVKRQVELRGWHVWDESPYESRVEAESKPPIREQKVHIKEPVKAPPEESIKTSWEQPETLDAPVEPPPVQTIQPQEVIGPPRQAVASSVPREPLSPRTTPSVPESTRIPTEPERKERTAARQAAVTSSVPREPLSPRTTPSVPESTRIATEAERKERATPRQAAVASSVRREATSPRPTSSLPESPRVPVESDTTEKASAAPRLPTRNQVVWFDIPVRDMDRAMRFYSAVLGKPLKKEQAGPGAAMVVLPYAEGAVGGSLIQSLDSRPSDSGPLLYLNTQGRIDEVLRTVEIFGGKVIAEKHSIAPFGFRAIILDSEGNRIALHSM